MDLSKELVKPEKSVLASQVEALREGLPKNEVFVQKSLSVGTLG